MSSYCSFFARLISENTKMYSHLIILFVSTIVSDAADSIWTNPNCPTNLRNLRKEYDQLKLQNEIEVKECKNEISQLRNENESLKSKIQQNSSLNLSALALTSHIEMCRGDKKLWRNKLDNILNATQMIQFEVSELKSEQNQEVYPKDCVEIQRSGKTESGVYKISPYGRSQVKVFCDMDTDGGGWTVILQRNKRGTQRENFYRNWTQYENGFGNVEGGDYNIGLKNLYALTSQHDQQLRVDLSDWEGNSAYANYKTFWIDGTDEKYKLRVGIYSGTAGDSLLYHNWQKFTTFDQDNDARSSGNCAGAYDGAWWYKDCYYSNLNGRYYSDGRKDLTGIEWYHWKNSYVTLKSAEMKIRPV